MQIRNVLTDDVIVDLSAENDYPFIFAPTLHVLENRQTKWELGVEWHNLSREKVRELRKVFDMDGVVKVVPDHVNALDVQYIVRLTSLFDFYSTNQSNWTQGYSGALVFEEP